MIYFVRFAGEGFIKIGFTGNLYRRLHGLQGAHYDELDVLGVMEGEREEEKEIHRRFSKFRYVGEWFIPDESLLDFIDENTRSLFPSEKPSSRRLGPCGLEPLRSYSELAKLVTEKTGHRTRKCDIVKLVQSHDLNHYQRTVLLPRIAEALGVKPADLLKRD